MRKLLIASMLAGCFAAPVMAQTAAAEAPAAAPVNPFTGNVTLASEYLYRGIAQTNRKPAIQGGFDYAHPSGFYVGTWASSISWLGDAGYGSYSLEWDIYGGYKTEIAKDLTLDVGALQYYYPGTRAAAANSWANPNTFEVYGALTYQEFTAKYSHSTTNLFGANSPSGKDTKGSGYLDLGYAHDLGEGWGVNAHIGHQTVKNFSDASYSDYKLGVTKDIGVGTIGASYLTTNAKGDVGQPYRSALGKDLGAGRLLLTFTKTL